MQQQPLGFSVKSLVKSMILVSYVEICNAYFGLVITEYNK